MNIFFVDVNPTIAATLLPDNYTGSKNFGGKMIIESAQMLANAYLPEQLVSAPKTKTGNIRKYSYLHHPCSKWVLKSIKNFDWLLEHAIQLVIEKQRRSGPLHFTASFIEWCVDNRPSLPDLGFTPPALAMPDDYKRDSPTISYRKYIIGEKLKQLPCVWSLGEPSFIREQYD